MSPTQTKNKMKASSFELLRDALLNDREAFEIFAREGDVDASMMDDQTQNWVRAQAETHDIRTAADAREYCNALKS